MGFGGGHGCFLCDQTELGFSTEPLKQLSHSWSNTLHKVFPSWVPGPARPAYVAVLLRVDPSQLPFPPSHPTPVLHLSLPCSQPFLWDSLPPQIQPSALSIFNFPLSDFWEWTVTCAGEFMTLLAHTLPLTFSLIIPCFKKKKLIVFKVPFLQI